MRRFWIDQIPQVGKVTNLDAEESQHIAKVLRLSAGDQIQIWDGSSSARAHIDSIQKGTVWVETLEMSPAPEIALPEIHIYVPLIKAERFEWALEKLTEIGAATVTPFHSEYSQVNLKVAAAKHGRWQRIVKEASKQCQRPQLMALNAAVSFIEALKPHSSKSSTTESALRYICTVPDREAEGTIVLSSLDLVRKLAESASQIENVEILVGPEGGFSKEEVKAAVSAGYVPLGLGPNILRAETACIVATSLCVVGRESPKLTDE
jgi:16S rRNA (uracil1498-N3)-methyltransferase